MRASLSRSAVLLIALLSSEPSFADKGVFHRVTDAGETYADIADHYYGHRYLERHLRLFNRRPEPLKEGTTIIIPTYELIPVKRGQAMHEFAAEHLSDPGRAEYLAELHGLRGRDRKLPRPGKRLKVVQSLKHVVRKGETLESIANLYYRDVGPRRIRLIMLFNELQSESIRSGSSLRIPLDTPEFSRVTVAFRARAPFTIKRAIAELPPPPPPPPANAPRSTPKRSPPPPKVDVAEELERAERLYGDGEYEACAKHTANVLASGGVGAAARIELLRLHAFSQIALGDYQAAKASFEKILAIDPKYQLDLYQTSPKILDIFEAVALR